MNVGAILRKCREERGQSVSEVSDATNIQPWILEALEDDSLAGRMSEIYVRGFLTTYGRYLHLEPERLLTEMPKEETNLDIIEQPPEPIPASEAFPLPDLRAWVKPLAAAAFVGLVLWVNPFAALANLSLPSFGKPQLASVAGAAGGAAGANLAALNIKTSEPLYLTVTAKRPTWIQLWADGKLIVQQRLQRGDTERWKASENFRLIVAKPGNVEAAINQVPITSALVGMKGRLGITHRGVQPLEPASG